jgi:hypothetical protein
MAEDGRPTDISQDVWDQMSAGDRQFFRLNSGWFGGAAAQTKHSPETGAMSEAGKTPDLPGTKTLDYLGLGLLLAAPAVVVDMYVRGSPIDWRKVTVAAAVSCLAGGLCVWASHWWQAWRTANNRLLPYLAAFENRFWGKGVIVAAAIGFALVLRSLLSVEPPSAQPGFTQQQVNEKIAAAIKPIQAQLDAANREIAAKNQQIQNLLHPPPPPVPPPQPKPHYSADEVEIIQTALRSMYAVATTKCKPSADTNWRLATSWMNDPASINNDPRGFAYKLIADRDSIRECDSGFRKIIDANGLYSHELQEPLPYDQASNVIGTMNVLIENLDELGKSTTKLSVNNLLIEQWKGWSGASQIYNVWVGDVTNGITKKIDEFRNWHN